MKKVFFLMCLMITQVFSASWVSTMPTWDESCISLIPEQTNGPDFKDFRFYSEGYYPDIVEDSLITFSFEFGVSGDWQSNIRYLKIPWEVICNDSVAVFRGTNMDCKLKSEDTVFCQQKGMSLQRGYQKCEVFVKTMSSGNNNTCQNANILGFSTSHFSDSYRILTLQEYFNKKGLDIQRQSVDYSFYLFLATLALVTVTIIYVILTHSLVKQGQTQTQLMLKQGKKERVVDLIKTIITPFIINLKANENMFKKRYYDWERDPKTKEILLRAGKHGTRTYDLKVDRKRDRIIFDKFIKNHSKLEKDLDNYGSKLDSFKIKLKELIISVLTPKFEKECIALVDNNSSIDKMYVAPVTAAWIINKFIMEQESFDRKYKSSFPHHSKTFLDFYNEKGIKLHNKVKKNKKFIKKKDEILAFSKELEEDSKKLKNELIKIREDYGEEYNIPEKEYGEDEKVLI